MLSDEHASISHGPEGYLLRDDGSATGVYLRATEGRPLEVMPGNLVRAGRQFLLFAKKNGHLQFVHYDINGNEIKRYDLSEKPTFVGRDAPDIVLDQSDKTLSRRHLSITIKNEKIYIKDLKSVNGTFLKVKDAVKLEDGDRFRVGKQVFRFVAKGDVPEKTIYTTGKTVIPKDLSESVTPAKPAELGELSVTFQGVGKTFSYKKGQTVCEIAEQNGLDIDAECHAGLCGLDPIRIISGTENVNELGEDEEATLEDCELNPKECRMACMVKPTGPVVVELLKR
jgi:pSer/pThr/pTyr-binding forkhead associated (FHA) protein/ferredoxin